MSSQHRATWGYASPLIDRVRAAGSEIRLCGYTIALAEDFGFCRGVQRAVRLACAARERYPDRRIHITAEMVHNPEVNGDLRSSGILFMAEEGDPGEILASLTSADVVLLPAFGVTMEYLQRLEATGCTIVDTTCGSVSNVWRRVESYARDGFTALIHGKYDHEETAATVSRAGKYLVVKDENEAQAVCAQIMHGGDTESFQTRFARACSLGFDPAHDLEWVGMANQTTMRSAESERIAEMLNMALTRRYGPESGHFRSFDTICRATQDRQDAVERLLDRGLGVALVVGGVNSCNTANLCRMAALRAPAYHIENSDCLLDDGAIRHRPPGEERWTTTTDWLPAEPSRIGVTAGASTPDSIVEEVVRRLARLLGHPEAFTEPS